MQIRDQLTRELEHSDPPPLGTIVADAAATGRRRQRRRMFGGAAAGLAVVAVVGAAVIVSAPATTGRGTPRPMPPAAAAAPVPATGQAVVALLESSMPPGGTFTEVDFATEDHQAYGGFLYDDGHGAATVSGGVADAPADYNVPGMACPPDASGFTCEIRPLPDGAQARIMTMGPYGDCTDAKCSIKDVRVEVRRADGAYVTAEAYNGPFGHGRASTRADTVLSVDRLIAIASDPRFGLTMDADLVADAAQNIHISE